MKQEVEKPTSVIQIFQKGIIKLTNQLLKGFGISKIIYIVIKLLEHLQMIYFLLSKNQKDPQSILGIFQTFLEYVSTDALIKFSSVVFQPLLYASFSVLVVIIVLAVVIAIKTDWSKSTPYLVKVFTPIVCYFLYLFKTVLFIPILKIIGIAIIPSIATSLNIPELSIISQSIGILITILFAVVTIYILVFFKDANPFSQLPYAGQTAFKGLIWMLFKAVMVFVTLIDTIHQHGFAKNAAFTSIFFLFILYSHYEIGLYKIYYRKIENYFLYACFILGVIFMTDYHQGGISSTFYIVPLNILAYLMCKWVISFKIKRVEAYRFLLIEDSKELEEHIINLVQLIDGIGLRQNRVALIGYIQYHQRQCNIGVTCPCNKLCNIKTEKKSEIKLEAFKFVVTLLTESKRKFPNNNRIDLLLGLLYHYRIKNSLQAIYAITKMAASSNASTVDRLYEYFYLQRIEREMVEMDQIEVNKTVQINKYLEYTNKMVNFENNIESCTRHHVQFWKLIMDTNPDIRHLEDIGTQITRCKDQLKGQFDSIASINANSIHLLTIYGKFLLEVTNQESYNVKYIEKAQIILKNIKQSSKIDDNEAKYEQNSKTAVVIISGDDAKLGAVVHTNNFVRDLIGYQRSELIDKNVAAIMPKIYGEYHDQTLRKYVGSSESKVNGHQRVVPALTKDGFMMPVTALTKVLPSLVNGIQIVAFIAKYQVIPEEDQTIKTMHFMLYRADNERIMGISEGCYNTFGISPSLMYGHPLNLNNQLTIQHIFGVSIEKGEEGRICSSLQMGEVFCTLNTKQLKNQFVFNSGSLKNAMGDSNDENQYEGVQMEVSIMLILSSVYNKIPLKLLGIYTRENKPKARIATTGDNSNSQKSQSIFSYQSHVSLKKSKKDFKDRSIMGDDVGKVEGDDYKNLKDFKNFISIKRQPSAITAMSTICLLFIVILVFSIVVLIFNYLEVQTINKNIIQLHRLTLESQMVVPQLLTQLEKKLYAYQLATSNTTGLTSIDNINQTLSNYIALAKLFQLDLLPYKYFFEESYNQKISQYDMSLTGSITNTSHFEQEVVNNYITKFEAMIMSDLALYTSSNTSQKQSSNNYKEYNQVQLDMLYSIRSALNASNQVSHGWYSSRINMRRTIIIAVNAVMMGVTILWVILLLPYILSVTKINNRVLSLFTLIPSQEISKLIYSCLSFLHHNLKEAAINYEEVDFYNQNIQRQLKGHGLQKSLNQSNLQSPSQFNMFLTQTQGQLRRGQRGTLETDNMVDMQDKFQKMNNSEDRNKKIIIFKFIIISILILGFAVFNLFFSLNIITSTERNVSDYQLVGRRPALIRNVKMLLAQYLTDPTRQPTGFTSIRTLNQDIINEFYLLEANLLYLDLEGSTDLYNMYNNGDCCSTVSSYSAYSIFNEQMSVVECLSLNSGVFKKGLKTGVVSVLQDMRSVLSLYPTTIPQNVHRDKIIEYDKIVKYIETPMLAVMRSIEASIDSRVELSKLIIVLSGSVFILILLLCWKFIWANYLSTLNIKIWRTKGLLNLIPMRIITANNHLKNEFTSGQLENAVR